MAAGLKASSCTCILIILLVVSSHVARHGEARPLAAAVAASKGADGEEDSPQYSSDQGQQAAATATSKMASTDGRPTSPGHSPGIGNKATGNVR
ncbi:hypothetical protein ABZP36_034662 [Zizania latifolia]